MSGLSIQNIQKSFQDTPVLKDISLEITDGSFTVLLGPSGCGKSTLLRTIAGLEKPDGGHITIGETEVTKLNPGDRDVAMVFQNYALYPHLNVYQNIEYGMKARKVPKAERQVLVQDALSMVRLQDQAQKLPAKMSGGQRQRVALARAIVKRPKVFLMDEPLSNLDAKLRGEMRFELIDLYSKLHTTFLYVTHDQVEAMSMGTHIVIMDKGVVQQQGSPREIYEDPCNTFVAGFIGSPPCNLIAADTYTFAIRPENIALQKPEEAYIETFGNIVSSEHLGNESIHGVRTGFGVISVRTPNFWDNAMSSIRLFFPKRHMMSFEADGSRVRDELRHHKALAGFEKVVIEQEKCAI